MRRPCLVAAALAVGLTTIAAALGAHGPDTGETIRLNASDQASAQAATLRRSDFFPTSGGTWRNVPAKPYLSAPFDCPLGANMSIFVVTGVARTRWLGGIMEVDTQTDVLARPWMLKGEWQKRVNPQALRCALESLSKSLAAKGEALISVTTTSLPSLGASALGLRAVVAERGTPERLVTEALILVRSRTAIVIMVNGFLSDDAEIFATAVRCGRLLAGRIQA